MSSTASGESHSSRDRDRDRESPLNSPVLTPSTSSSLWPTSSVSRKAADADELLSEKMRNYELRHGVSARVRDRLGASAAGGWQTQQQSQTMRGVSVNADVNGSKSAYGTPTQHGRKLFDQ